MRKVREISKRNSNIISIIFTSLAIYMASVGLNATLYESSRDKLYTKALEQGISPERRDHLNSLGIMAEADRMSFRPLIPFSSFMSRPYDSELK